MTMQEAMQAAKEGQRLWFRPVSWRGLGQALCFHGDWGVALVPDKRGGSRASFPSFEDAVGSWEAVSPDVVNGERP